MAAKKTASGSTKKAAKKAAARTPKAPKKAASARAAPRKGAKAPAAARKSARKAAPARKAPKARHPVVHWEIQSANPGRLHAFYGDVFGWAIAADEDMNYAMVASGGSGDTINGGIGPGSASRVVVYAQVPDIEEVLERVLEHGGKLVRPRQEMGPVTMALYEDPEGNLMGLVED